MEKYRNRLIRNSIGYLLMIILTLLIWVIFVNPFSLPIPFSAGQQGLSPLVTGGVMGGVGSLIYNTVTSVRAVKNSKVLAAQYQKKKDERDIAIEISAYSSACRILMYLLIPAWVLSAAFSSVVFYTLLCVMITAAAIYFICHAYYVHKY
ncbi:MAG TPA: hypothetical protein VHP31_02570 [Caproicibacter sp.]|nr:hypothetical protein [Caproicibacter sp.]